jgi:hypothetical protein
MVRSQKRKLANSNDCLEKSESSLNVTVDFDSLFFFEFFLCLMKLAVFLKESSFDSSIKGNL